LGPRTSPRPHPSTRRPWTTSRPYSDGCEDFTYGQCPESLADDRLIAVIKYHHPENCVRACQDDYPGHCKSIVYQPDHYNMTTGRCVLWTETVGEYLHQCNMHSGSIQENSYCEDPTYYNGEICSGYRNTGCHFATNGLVGELKDILEESECRRACELPGLCNYYVHDKDNDICYLYEWSQHNCQGIVGPPDPDVDPRCLRLTEE